MLCKAGSALIRPNEIGSSKVFIGLKSIASQYNVMAIHELPLHVVTKAFSTI